MTLRNYIELLLRARDTDVVTVNLNDFAKAVTLEEGLKQSVSIAQVKEILKITFTNLAELSDEEVRYILDKYRNDD